MENKKAMKKIVDAFSTGDISEVDLIFSPDYIDHQNDKDRSEGIIVDGPAEFKQIVTGARKSLPNLNVTIEDIFTEEDKVVARLQWHSTDSDGKKIERETIEILRLLDGKVAEHWGAEEWRKNIDDNV